jgi:hypothetical protein
MKYYAKISEILSRLKELQPTKATLWDYMLTHAQLAVHLALRESGQTAFLMIISTDSIQCPIRWDSPQFSIVEVNGLEDEAFFIISDENANVLLECHGGVILYEGDEQKFGASLRKFLLYPEELEEHQTDPTIKSDDGVDNS